MFVGGGAGEEEDAACSSAFVCVILRNPHLASTLATLQSLGFNATQKWHEYADSLVVGAVEAAQAEGFPLQGKPEGACRMGCERGLFCGWRNCLRRVVRPSDAGTARQCAIAVGGALHGRCRPPWLQPSRIQPCLVALEPIPCLVSHLAPSPHPSPCLPTLHPHLSFHSACPPCSPHGECVCGDALDVCRLLRRLPHEGACSAACIALLLLLRLFGSLPMAQDSFTTLLMMPACPSLLPAPRWSPLAPCLVQHCAGAIMLASVVDGSTGTVGRWMGWVGS